VLQTADGLGLFYKINKIYNSVVYEAQSVFALRNTAINIFFNHFSTKIEYFFNFAKNSNHLQKSFDYFFLIKHGANIKKICKKHKNNNQSIKSISTLQISQKTTIK